MSRPTALAIGLPETTMAWAPSATRALPARLQPGSMPVCPVCAERDVVSSEPARTGARYRSWRSFMVGLIYRHSWLRTAAGPTPREPTASPAAYRAPEPAQRSDPPGHGARDRGSDRCRGRVGPGRGRASEGRDRPCHGADRGLLSRGRPAPPRRRGGGARARVEIARAMELIEASFRAGGRLLYVGAGSSGRLGVLDAAECPPTFGTPPEMVVGIIAGGAPALLKSVEGAEDDPNAGIAEMDARRVGPNDTVVGIAASGTTPFVRAALGRAQALGAKTVFPTCSEPPAVLRDTCDVTIAALTGPEVVTGSTRMKAGTATKLVLNTLTTGAMIRLGKTYGNLMVDLKAWNAKLVDRGERIVMEVARVGRTEARSAIDAAGGSVRTAIVIAARGVAR